MERSERKDSTAFLPLSGEKQKLVRALARRKERTRHSLYLVEGLRLVREAAAHPDLCQFIYGTRAHLQNLDVSIPRFEYVEDDLFLTENSQRLGAVLSTGLAPTSQEFFSLPGPLLILDTIADPGNAGTILRAADWYGLNGVGFMVGSVDPWNPKSVRATMGALLRTMVSIDLRVVDLQSSGRKVYSLEAGGSIIVGRSELDREGVYVVGNEAHGVSEGVSKLADGKVTIPGARGESLNAAMAATILAHELYRTKSLRQE